MHASGFPRSSRGSTPAPAFVHKKHPRGSSARTRFSGSHECVGEARGRTRLFQSCGLGAASGVAGPRGHATGAMRSRGTVPAALRFCATAAPPPLSRRGPVLARPPSPCAMCATLPAPEPAPGGTAAPRGGRGRERSGHQEGLPQARDGARAPGPGARPAAASGGAPSGARRLPPATPDAARGAEMAPRQEPRRPRGQGQVPGDLARVLGGGGRREARAVRRVRRRRGRCQPTRLVQS